MGPVMDCNVAKQLAIVAEVMKTVALLFGALIVSVCIHLFGTAKEE